MGIIYLQVISTARNLFWKIMSSYWRQKENCGNEEAKKGGRGPSAELLLALKMQVVKLAGFVFFY